MTTHAEHTWHVPGCWDCEDQADNESKAELWAQIAAHRSAAEETR